MIIEKQRVIKYRVIRVSQDELRYKKDRFNNLIGSIRNTKKCFNCDSLFVSRDRVYLIDVSTIADTPRYSQKLVCFWCANSIEREIDND